MFHGHSPFPDQQIKPGDDGFEKNALGEIDRLSKPPHRNLCLVDTLFWGGMGFLACQNPVGQECPTYLCGFDYAQGAPDHRAR